MNNNSTPSFPSRMPASIVIKSIDFMPMSGHGQQYRRPLVTNLTEETQNNLTIASGRINYRRQHTPEPHPASLTAPYLHNFVMPQVEGVPVDFPSVDGKGWGGEVASFIIEAEIQLHGGIEPHKYYIAGYTDRPVPRNGDPIDPSILLTINSVFEYRKVQQMTPAGMDQKEILVNAAQVLFDAQHRGVDEPCLRRQRPYEIAVAATRWTDPLLNRPGFTAVDTRDILTNSPVFSTYANNDPTIWTEALLTSNIEALTHQRLMGDVEQRHGYDYRITVARFSRDPEVWQSPFVRALSAVKDGMLSAQFTLNDLSLIDTTAMRKIHVLLAQKPSDDVFYSSFEGLDADTQAANYIANSVPAILAKYGIRVMDFGARNFFNPAQLTATGVAGVNDFIDLKVVDECLAEIRLRVFDVISERNKRSYMFAGRFDLFGSSQFDLEFDKQGGRHYASPTFANALFSPLLVMGEETLKQNSLAFDTAFQHVVAVPVPETMPGDEVDLNVEDHILNGDALDMKYNPNGDGEHPIFTRAAWRAAVDQQETISGYWDWAAHQLKKQHEGN